MRNAEMKHVQNQPRVHFLTFFRSLLLLDERTAHFESSKKAARECRKAAAKIWLEQFHNNGNVD